MDQIEKLSLIQFSQSNINFQTVSYSILTMRTKQYFQLNSSLLLLFLAITINSSVIPNGIRKANQQPELEKYLISSKDNNVNSNPKSQQITGKQGILQFSDSDSPFDNIAQSLKDIQLIDTPVHSQILDSQKLAIISQIDSKIINKFKNPNANAANKDLQLKSALNRNIQDKITEYVQAVMKQNRQSILMHNSRSDRKYELAENKFIIYTANEFKQMFLTLQEPNSSYVKNQPIVQVVLPASKMSKNNRLLQQNITINWKELKKMTSVKYQKQCGACYSFAALAAVQSAYILKGQFLNLAEQQIIDCSNSYGNLGCVGGWTINSYKYIKNFGVVYESDYPYAATYNNCSVPNGKTKYFIKDYVELKNDCNAVTQALLLQPLSIAINADNWQYYSSGVYTDCKAGPSNHGVVLAGVDSTSWLIKNSWGYSWGDQGYIKVSRTAANNACNICQWASYPIL